VWGLLTVSGHLGSWQKGHDSFAISGDHVTCLRHVGQSGAVLVNGQLEGEGSLARRFIPARECSSGVECLELGRSHPFLLTLCVYILGAIET